MSDPTSEALGPFVIIQAAVAVAIGLGIAASWFRGEKSKGRSTSDGVQVYMDGPLVKAIEILQGMYRVLGEMREENKDTVAEFRQRHEAELNLLREIAQTAKVGQDRAVDADEGARRRRRDHSDT
jgi:hypothetical protein